MRSGVVSPGLSALLFTRLFGLSAVVGAGLRAGEKEESRPDLGPNASLRGYRPFPEARRAFFVTRRQIFRRKR